MVPPSDQSQILQRLRVGVTGLVLVVLLIVIASALFRSASDEPPVSEADTYSTDMGNAVDALNMVEAPRQDEPLAELGVSPGSAPDNAVDQAPAVPAR